MQVFIGKSAPDFVAKAVMPNNAIDVQFNLREYAKNHYCLLFFYPLDFTFVCPSELVTLNNKLEQFEALDTKVVAISVDSEFSHLAWKKTPPSAGGIGDLKIPLISDLGGIIARTYGILDDNHTALRATFLIDPEFTVRHLLVNDSAVGRNIDESLRLINAFRTNHRTGDVCPAEWHPGTPTLQPTLESVAEYLTKTVRTISSAS